MRIRTEHNGHVTGNTEGDAVACGIDTGGGLAHLMTVLSGLYADAPAAVLREYSTNALDAHRAAGTAEPIRITLPSPLNPVLSIQDAGPGLSETEIMQVYATYGASSKRDSDDQVGAFGLGSKSAFTLGQQFTVTGTKDGAKTLALFALNAEGIPTVSIQARERTTEPNGVTVQIAVSEVERVRAAAGPLFATWQPGSVLVDGHPPRSIYDDGMDLGGGIVVAEPTDDAPHEGLIIVMGNIGYPVPSEMVRDLQLRLPEPLCPVLTAARLAWGGVFATVAIGAVDITPAREGLKTTERTLQRLEQVVIDLDTQFRQTMQAVADAAPSAAAAACAVSRLRRRLPDRHCTVQWHGTTVSEEVEAPVPSSRHMPERDRFVHNRSGPARLYLGEDLDAVLVVTGVPDGAQEIALRHAPAFRTHADTPVRHLIYSQDTHGAYGWFEFGTTAGFPTISYADYLATGKSPASKHRPRGDVDYHVLAVDGMPEQRCTATEIAARGRPVVTFASTTELDETLASSAELRTHALTGTTPVLLTQGRTSQALARRLGNTVELRRGSEHVERIAAELLSTVTDDDRDCYRAQMQYAYGRIGLSLRVLTDAADRITNPTARDIIGALKRGGEMTDAERQRQELLRAAARAAPDHAHTLPKVSSLMREFPLLIGCRDSHIEHVIAYINALS